MKSTEQERQEFEAWTAGAYCLERSSRNTDVYSSTITQCAFDAWQAARRAPVAPVPQGLREAAQRAHDWMDSQADSQSKGNYHSFDLLCLRQERDALAEALAAAHQPPKADDGPSSCAHCGNPWGEAAPVQLPEYGIDTANHAGIRVRGYTKDQVLAILAKHGIKTT